MRALTPQSSGFGLGLLLPGAAFSGVKTHVPSPLSFATSSLRSRAPRLTLKKQPSAGPRCGGAGTACPVLMLWTAPLSRRSDARLSDRAEKLRADLAAKQNAEAAGWFGFVAGCLVLALITVAPCRLSCRQSLGKPCCKERLLLFL